MTVVETAVVTAITILKSIHEFSRFCISIISDRKPVSSFRIVRYLILCSVTKYMQLKEIYDT